MKSAIKMTIGVALAIVWGFIFLVMPATAADLNGNNQGNFVNNTKGNGEAKGTANFTMSFSGSARTKGDFNSDTNVDMQNMFYGDDREYYYRPAK